MLAALRRDFQIAPVTFVMLAASVVLFFVTELYRSGNDDPTAGRRTFGAVEGLAFVDEGEIKGPFDLWEGPWWRWLRIPASAFHHGGLLHLFFNVTSLWFLGPLLERRFWRPAYVGFWFFAAVVPFLPEYFLGNYPIGLSGVACAMFGWCLVERDYDPAVAYRIHSGTIRSFWTFLFLAIGATAAGLIQIANVAHFVGVGYGWLNALANRSRRIRVAWIVGHVLVPVAIWGILHPVWSGRYHAFLGIKAAQRADDDAAGLAHFQEAVRRDPALPRVWMALAGIRWNQQDRAGAWDLALTGLTHNRSSEPLTDFTRRLWRGMPASERMAAKEAVRTRFGDEADAWLQRLNMVSRLSIDPSADDSAAEGRTL